MKEFQISSHHHTIMATATPATPTLATTCPMKDPSPYERIILDIEDRPDLKKEVEDATDLLDYVMCRIPDPKDAKYKDDKVREALHEAY